MVALPASITDAELRAVTGGPIKLSNYNGKVYLVNLWATWCGPCRLEMPDLVKISSEYKSRGLVVNYDEELRIRPTNEILLRSIAHASGGTYRLDVDAAGSLPSAHTVSR